MIAQLLLLVAPLLLPAFLSIALWRGDADTWRESRERASHPAAVGLSHDPAGAAVTRAGRVEGGARKRCAGHAAPAAPTGRAIPTTQSA